MKKKLNLIITIILIISILTSCKRGSKKEIKLEEKEKAPKSLVSIAEELDEIFTSISDIEKTIELTPSEFEALQSEKENKKEESKKEENKKEEKPEEKLEAKDKELLKKWVDIDKKIDKIHKNWNDYEIEAMQKVANPEKSKEFKKNLNLCTKAVEDRNTKDILDTGSKTVLSLASFFELYKDEIKGELSRIKYAAYQAYLVSETDIEKSKKLLDSTEESISKLRQKLAKNKEKIKTLDKLALSIEDMKQSLGENNKKLLKIKREIILNNIKSLEK